MQLGEISRRSFQEIIGSLQALPLSSIPQYPTNV
jgi:hypothetical protein